jgi:hypothetical protein
MADFDDGPQCPILPPLILTIGALAWKALEYCERVDFLLSIRSENFLVIFKLFVNYGAWILAAIGLIWLFLVRNQKKRPISSEMIVVIGVLAFIWGVLITTFASGGVPEILSTYGGSSTECHAVAQTNRLVGFAQNYDLAVVCGLEDPGTDKFNDTRVTISQRYSIHEATIPIAVPFSPIISSTLQRAIASGLPAFSVWAYPVLVLRTPICRLSIL